MAGFEREPMRRMMIAVVMVLAGAAFGQGPERITHPALMEMVDKAVGAKAAEGIRLSAIQQREIAAAHEAFERNVKGFLRRHAAGTLKGEMNVPSAEAVERRIMELLNKMQREAVEQAMKAAAEKRAAERKSVRSSDSSGQMPVDSSSPRSSSRGKSESKSDQKEDAQKPRRWSSLDAKQQAAAVQDLMNQLSAKDREALVKELGEKK
jgi:hypothetical protein